MCDLPVLFLNVCFHAETQAAPPSALGQKVCLSGSWNCWASLCHKTKREYQDRVLRARLLPSVVPAAATDAPRTVAVRWRSAAVSRAARNQPQHFRMSSGVGLFLRATHCEAAAAGLRDTAALRGCSKTCGVRVFAAQCSRESATQTASSRAAA